MAESLFDAEPLPPPNPWPTRLLVAGAVLIVLAGVTWWQYRFHAEKVFVRQFMDALVAGDYPTAYKIWNATPVYSYQAFLEDWGETTAMGRVKSYEILEVKPTAGVLLQVPVQGGGRSRTLQVKGKSSGVIVSVRVNGLEPPIRLWVERNPPRLSFPPY